MTAYATATKQPPRTMTADEQKALLKTTGDHKAGFRDHMLFAIALGTGLREHEILALNVGDVFAPAAPGSKSRKARPRIELRVFKRSNKKADEQAVFLPDALRYKLEKFYRMLLAERGELTDDSPLFVSREGGRLSQRMARHAFGEWQKKAGFAKHYRFHHLRHTALTNLYRITGDIRLVQRQARHASITSTTIYAAPADEDVRLAVANLPC